MSAPDQVAENHGLSTVVRLLRNPRLGDLDVHRGGRLEGVPVRDSGKGRLGAVPVNPQLSGGDASQSLVPSRASLVAAAPSRGIDQ